MSLLFLLKKYMMWLLGFWLLPGTSCSMPRLEKSEACRVPGRLITLCMWSGQGSVFFHRHQANNFLLLPGTSPARRGYAIQTGSKYIFHLKIVDPVQSKFQSSQTSSKFNEKCLEQFRKIVVYRNLTMNPAPRHAIQQWLSESSRSRVDISEATNWQSSSKFVRLFFFLLRSDPSFF